MPRTHVQFRQKVYLAGLLMGTALLGVALLKGGSAVPDKSRMNTKGIRGAAATAFVQNSRTKTAEAVQKQPLYQQAVLACRKRQYREAADLLARLASSSGLSAEETTFVRRQQAICLQDAHLPAPSMLRAASPPALRLPASAAPSHSLSAADADCGPRALRLVCEQQGIAVGLDQMRRQAHTTAQGTSLAGLAKAAKAVGLKVEGVQVSREALAETDMPAIAWVNGNHYIAVLKLQGEGENGTATIHDPNNAFEQTLSQESLLRQCSGYLLLAHK